MFLSAAAAIMYDSEYTSSPEAIAFTNIRFSFACSRRVFLIMFLSVIISQPSGFGLLMNSSYFAQAILNVSCTDSSTRYSWSRELRAYAKKLLVHFIVYFCNDLSLVCVQTHKLTSQSPSQLLMHRFCFAQYPPDARQSFSLSLRLYGQVAL